MTDFKEIIINAGSDRCNSHHGSGVFNDQRQCVLKNGHDGVHKFILCWYP